uniref:Methylenetetrahydrofolate reductase 2 n=1 Tax=Rhizophora mucronata TaxID=61149 RepID=A0A2P2IPG4_RHIMU
MMTRLIIQKAIFQGQLVGISIHMAGGVTLVIHPMVLRVTISHEFNSAASFS